MCAWGEVGGGQGEEKGKENSLFKKNRLTSDLKKKKKLQEAIKQYLPSPWERKI